mgnify:FL=1
MKISSEKLVSMTYTIYEGDNLLESVATPVSFIFGQETNLLPIVESALHGKEKNDDISIEVSPELGFGLRDDSLIFTDSIDNVPVEYRKLGMQIEFANDKGTTRKFRVISVDNGKITFDGNHIFAGKHLVYKIKIVDVAETEKVKS